MSVILQTILVLILKLRPSTCWTELFWLQVSKALFKHLK